MITGMHLGKKKKHEWQQNDPLKKCWALLFEFRAPSGTDRIWMIGTNWKRILLSFNNKHTLNIAPRSPPTDASWFLQGCMFRWIIMEWCDSLLICSQIAEAQIDHTAAVLLEIQSYAQERFRWSETGLLYRLPHTWVGYSGPGLKMMQMSWN